MQVWLQIFYFLAIVHFDIFSSHYYYSFLSICFYLTYLITDFDFSSNNQYIASTSMDKTIRVWEMNKGHCIRVIYGTSSQHCIRFHPVSALSTS